MIWFEERVNSALNRTRPREVVTMMGREGKEVPAAVEKIRGLRFTPNFEFGPGVESEPTGAEPAIESVLYASYAGSVSMPDGSEGWRS